MEEMIPLLYQALSTPRGIVIKAVPLETVKAHLYQARVKASDPSLARLSFRTSPINPDEIWITHDGTQNESNS